MRGAQPFRGFLPWRLPDAGPGARGCVCDGPASETLHRRRHSGFITRHGCSTAEEAMGFSRTAVYETSVASRSLRISCSA